MAPAASPLIHVGKYQPADNNGREQYLFLRQTAPDRYSWFVEASKGREVETDLFADTPEEALRAAHIEWKSHGFRTVICGWRYTLPERDEHGCNARFHHMVASYTTPTGVYFDEQLGHNCLVEAASQEALNLWHRLKEENRL